MLRFTFTHPLDNPVWLALTTEQRRFAETYNLARRFPTEVTSLAGFLEPTQEGYDSLASLVKAGEVAALLLEFPPAPPVGWIVVEAVPLLQMIHEGRKSVFPAGELEELTEQDAPQMLALAELTKPGPFGKRTRELGTYLGVRCEGKLVAMAGERLRIPGFTEVSAVCTHPEHSGKGYASALVSALVERIHERDELPFLHVRPDNTRAVELYKRLCFTERALLYLAALCKRAE